ncbi:MAG: cytochrome c biogenesis protein ResB [Rhodospirillaceae bacterium]|nr:cytochrome c biogenesis protein ResB [Rhodospirillaceae bacterium]
MTKPMWQFPWQYKESIAFISGIVVVGFALQVIFGPFDFYILSRPGNYIALAGMVGLIGLCLPFRKTPVIAWLASVPLAVALIGGLLLFGLAMGLIPQLKSGAALGDDWILRLGLAQITSCWPFVLLYGLGLFCLGLTIAQRLVAFRLGDYGFYLNHLGLWIFLAGLGLGAADMQRHVMYVTQGETEWRVFDNNQTLLELPIAVQLNQFEMEEYPPKITIIDRKTGVPQPEGGAEWLQIDERKPNGALGGWDVSVDRYLHYAVRSGEEEWSPNPMPGATQAAEITVRNRQTGEERKGWIAAGNTVQAIKALPLDDQYAVVMAQPEPKRFMSDITVYAKTGERIRALLEVNKPLKVGDWLVYQYGYDTQAGRLSSYSGFELVYDPWLIVEFVGIYMMMAGALCLIWKGRGKDVKGQTA